MIAQVVEIEAAVDLCKGLAENPRATRLRRTGILDVTSSMILVHGTTVPSRLSIVALGSSNRPPNVPTRNAALC